MTPPVSAFELVKKGRWAELSGPAAKVFIVLSYRQRSPLGWPNLTDLANGAGIDRRTLWRVLGELEQAGIVKIERGSKKDSKTQKNCYHLLDLPGTPDAPGRIDKPGTPDAPIPGTSDAQNQGHPMSLHKNKGKERTHAAVNGGRVWGLWIDCNREAGRRDPVKAKADLGAGKNLASMIQGGELSEAELRECMAAYLADQDPWLAKPGHPLRLLSGRLNGYLNSGGTPMTPEQVKASLRMRETEDRLAREGKV